MKKSGRVFLISTLVALSAAQWGCTQASEGERLESAKAHIGKNDLKAATIELKNVLEKNPESSEGRFLLGKVLLESGNPVTAEVELRKAKELKGDASRWAPALARAVLLQFRFAKLIEEFGTTALSDAGAQADLNASVAAAYAGTGQRDQAKALIESTLTRMPGHVPTLLLEARVLARPGSLDESIALVDKVLAQEPRNVEGWQLLGDLQLLGKRDLAKAAVAYAKALELQRDSVAANASMVFVKLAAGDVPGARKQLDAMAKVVPGHPQTKFLDARVSFLEGRAARARELVQQALRVMPNHVPLLELAGAVELQLNSLQQAETYLNKALTLSPDLVSVRRMLANAMMRSGKPAKALEVLGPNLVAGRADPVSLSLAAEAQMQTGDFNKAEELLQQAAKNAPDDPKYRTALALTQLAKGQVDAAFSELRAISAASTDTLADLTLINALMRRQDFDAALQAIDALQRKQPDKPLAASLRGRALLAQRKLPEARKSFEQALEKDPVFYPAIANLALMDQADGKPEAAERRFEAVLKADPKNAQAYMALAVIKSRGKADNKDAVGQLLQSAIQASPGDAVPRLMLIHHWLSLRNMKAAQTAAQAGVAAMPDSLDMLDALGSLQLVAGEVNQSISTFSKIAAKQPNSVKVHLRLADAHLQANDYVSAERSFKRVLEIAPETINAQRGLIALSVRAKQPDRAVVVARLIQKQRPGDSVGYVLEGDIHAQFKDWNAAIKAYRAGIDKTNPAPAVERLYAATVAGKGKAEARRFVDDWIARHPTDSKFLVFLGNNAVNTNELVDAEKFYRDAVKANPNHPTAVNNQAWVSAKLGRPGAVALAEQAVKLAPDDPAMLDTLAFALAADKQFSKAVETAKLVLIKAPDEPTYRLNLAKLYLGAGDKTRAAAELEQLAGLGAKFPRQAEVAALLKSLQP